MATKKIEEYGRRTLPHLILAAQRHETPTYRMLADKIGIHWRPMTFILAYIRDEICLTRKPPLPMLTAIVINQQTGKPGDKFLPEGTDHLTDEQYQSAFKKHCEKVFSYQDWDDLLKELGIAPIV
jgi:hypothetical protein